MSRRETNPHLHFPTTTMSRRETNPHFSRPQRPQHEDLHQQPPIQLVSPPHREPRGQFPPHGGAPMQQEDPHYPPRDDHQTAPISRAPPRDDKPYPPYPPPSKPKVIFEEPSSSPKPLHTSELPPPPVHPPEPMQEHREPHKQQPSHGRRHRDDIKWPTRKTNRCCTWCGAAFCIIFWLVIIIGGLIVLIVYLVFRPQSPQFDVSAASLNAAYLDFGHLLNADFSILANFTNPNKKVHVDFSSVIIYLYYGSTLIASQYVEPFSAARVQSRFANIHMVTSQVQLPLGESQRLLKQMESNGVLLQVRGVFRAKSKLGSILRYPYNLYGLCNIMVSRPPGGMMLKKKCRTKR